MLLGKCFGVKDSLPFFIMKAGTTDNPINITISDHALKKKSSGRTETLFISFLFPAPALPGSGSMGIISE